MAEGYFTEAASLMREGGLDPREVLATISIIRIQDIWVKYFRVMGYFWVKLRDTGYFGQKLMGCGIHPSMLIFNVYM